MLTVKLTRTREEVRIEDRLLAREDRRINTSFVPSAPDEDIQGKMIAVESGVTQIGQYNVVVINRGTREGLEVGNVLAVLQAGNLAKDPDHQAVIKRLAKWLPKKATPEFKPKSERSRGRRK